MFIKALNSVMKLYAVIRGTQLFKEKKQKAVSVGGKLNWYKQPIRSN